MDSPAALPSQIRTWAQTFAPCPIIDVTPIGGGITDTKRRLLLADGEPLVIRWSDPQTWGATGHEHVRREALALQLLTRSTLPVPQLLASDLRDTSASGSVNLMTWLPGRVRHDHLGPDAITDLARLAVTVHRQPVPTQDRPPTFAFRGPDEPEVPAWARAPELWRRAINIWRSGPPPTVHGLLHRDFHLGNVLWNGDTVTGLIDWAETSWGPADLDVAHLCADFAMLHATADAETFRTEYLQRGGQLDPNPDAARFWVVSDILGFLPDPAHIIPAVSSNRPDLTPDDVRRGLEDLLARTLL